MAGFVNVRRDVDDKFYRYRYVCAPYSRCYVAQPLLNIAACLSSLPK